MPVMPRALASAISPAVRNVVAFVVHKGEDAKPASAGNRNDFVQQRAREHEPVAGGRAVELTAEFGKAQRHRTHRRGSS